MRARTCFLAVSALALATSVALGQSHTIKLKTHADPGKSVTVAETNSLKLAFSVSMDKMVLSEDTKTTDETKQFTEKILAVDQKGLKKYTRTYGKVVKQENGQPVTPSYVGKTILFERQGDRFVVSAEGGGVDTKDLKELTRSANDSVDEAKLMPATAVAVGETWTISRDVFTPLLREMKDGAETAKAKATGKLLKAYKKAGQQWGTIEVTLAVPVKKFGPLTLEKAIPFQVKMTVDAAIDGSSTAIQLKGQLTLRGSAPFERAGQTLTLNVRIEGEQRQEQSAEK